LAFRSILNSIGVREHVSGPTHNRTLDLILSHGINVNTVKILRHDGISDHYLVLCILHLAKFAKPTRCNKYVRTINCISISIYSFSWHFFL